MAMCQFLEPVIPMIEKNSEVDKPTLIHRCAGRLDYGLLQTLKMFVFTRMGRDERDNLYLI
jgi:hypothetical protein